MKDTTRKISYDRARRTTHEGKDQYEQPEDFFKCITLCKQVKQQLSQNQFELSIKE